MTPERFLTAGERSWLRDLGRGPVSWGPRRPVPEDLYRLLLAGLAFRSAVRISITTSGVDVLERVA